MSKKEQCGGEDEAFSLGEFQFGESLDIQENNQRHPSPPLSPHP